jgi:threonine dehydrogenase-like Zn-dependent dehydrogenase
MSHYQELVRREAEGRPIRVAVVGSGGSMGQRAALQLGKTPGMRMVASVDMDLGRAERAAELQGREWVLAAKPDEVALALRAGRTVVTNDAFAVMAGGRHHHARNIGRRCGVPTQALDPPRIASQGPPVPRQWESLRGPSFTFDLAFRDS